MQKGWAKLPRQLQHHWLFHHRRERTEFEAYCWLLFQATIKETTVTHRKSKVKLGKGCLAVSQTELANEWRWGSRQRVKRFLDRLAEDRLIELETSALGTIVRVCEELLLEASHGTMNVTTHEPGQNGMVGGMNKFDQQTYVTTESTARETNETGSEAELKPIERKVLRELRNIRGYPLDVEKDLSFVRSLLIDFPELDLLEEVKRFSVYKLDKPFKANANPRSQLRNWCKKAVEFQSKRGMRHAESGRSHQGKSHENHLVHYPTHSRVANSRRL